MHSFNLDTDLPALLSSLSCSVKYVSLFIKSEVSPDDFTHPSGF